jgi:Putative transposase
LRGWATCLCTAFFGYACAVRYLWNILCVPVKALSPLYRALFQDDMRQAGLRAPINPQVWTISWHVHSQVNHHGHSAFTSLAPYVFRIAISNQRLVSLKDHTVTFTYRKVGSARPRTTPVRPHTAIKPHKTTAGESTTDHTGVKAFPNSPNDAHMAMPPQGGRRMIHPRP